VGLYLVSVVCVRAAEEEAEVKGEAGEGEAEAEVVRNEAVAMSCEAEEEAGSEGFGGAVAGAFGSRVTAQHTTQYNRVNAVEMTIYCIQHNTTQHNTPQHNTTQHNTTQHNTTQHNTTHNIPLNLRRVSFHPTPVAPEFLSVML